jgi:signal transduction histidine kinase
MQRIIDIVSRLSRTCGSTLTLRSTAAHAAQVLAEEFPESMVVFFERDPRGDTVRAVIGVNVPAAWRMRAIHTGDIPLIAEALRNPDRVVRGAVVGSLHDGTAVTTGGATPHEVLCGALPDSSAEPIHLLMFVTAALHGEESLRELALETVRCLLGASAAITAGDASRARTLSAIHHAKVEWEHAVDALPDIVGLLDRRRRVVRVSRALERWRLGDVREALGADLHTAMHRTCTRADCPLRVAVDLAWQQLDEHGGASFEVDDVSLGRHVAVELLASVDPAADDAGGAAQRVAFSVSDVTTLRSAQRALADINQTLEQRVAERTEQLTATNAVLRAEIARRREVEQSLRASQAELQALSERLMNAQEDERKRIAQDLHDSVGQSLSAIKYSLERARVLLPRDEIDLATEVIETAVRWVQRVMVDLRSISMNLRPAQLDDLGAASAVNWLCRQWHDVYQDVEVGTDIAVEDADIPPTLSISVFRAVQESLNNVARHSGAQRVQVSMRLEDGTLRVVVQDDGAGFVLTSDAQRSADITGVRGLRGLRERAERTGGRCAIASAPGRGTCVQLEWPVAPGLAAREANACIN